MAQGGPEQFSHHGTSPATFWLAIIFPFIVVPVVVLRLWTSKVIVKKWHHDDTLTLIATIFAVLHSAVVCVEVKLGAGKNRNTVTENDILTTANVSRWGVVPLYCLTTLFIKASILTFYLRFSIDPKFRAATHIANFVVVSYSAINIGVTFAFDCTFDGQACIRLFCVFTACAAMNVVTDVAILLLPFWILRPMRTPLYNKLGLALILMGGGFVLGVSAYKLHITIENQARAQVTYGWANILRWSLIESWFGLFCASLPCLKVFFTTTFPNSHLWHLLGHSHNQRSPKLNHIET